MLFIYLIVTEGMLRTRFALRPKTDAITIQSTIAPDDSTGHSWTSLLSQVKSAMEKSAEAGDKLVEQLKSLVVGRGRWYSLPNKFDRLLENPIYVRYNLTLPVIREKVDMIFIVSSAPKRLERRTAIRETWWPFCKPVKRVSVFY